MKQRSVFVTFSILLIVILNLSYAYENRKSVKDVLVSSDQDLNPNRTDFEKKVPDTNDVNKQHDIVNIDLLKDILNKPASLINDSLRIELCKKRHPNFDFESLPKFDKTEMFKYANLNPCRVDCIVYETVKGSSNHSTKVKYAEYFVNGTQCRVREICLGQKCKPDPNNKNTDSYTTSTLTTPFITSTTENSPTTTTMPTTETNTLTPTTVTTTQQTVITTTKRRKPFICKEEGLFRDPKDPNCQSFLRCIKDTENGDLRKTDMGKCPEGTIFDEELGTCNYPPDSKPPCPNAKSNKDN